MSAIPAANPLERPERIFLTGEIPSPIEPPNHCRLVGRCPFANQECRTTPLQLWEAAPGHFHACIRSYKGEIDIPNYASTGPALIITKTSQEDERTAIADDAEI